MKKSIKVTLREILKKIEALCYELDSGDEITVTLREMSFGEFPEFVENEEILAELADTTPGENGFTVSYSVCFK